MAESRRLRTQAERDADGTAWRAAAATRPGYATYPDTASGSPCWWAKQGDSRPWRPAPWRTPWTGPDPMISGRIGPVPGDVMAALDAAQQMLAELPPPITCLRMHPIARQMLATRAEAAPPGHLAGPLTGFLGIPVIEDADLPYGEWRLIDADGRVVKQGNAARLGTGEQPQQPPTDPDIWVTTEPISPPRRRWWHRYTRRAR